MEEPFVSVDALVPLAVNHVCFDVILYVKRLARRPFVHQPANEVEVDWLRRRRVGDIPLQPCAWHHLAAAILLACARNSSTERSDFQRLQRPQHGTVFSRVYPPWLSSRSRPLYLKEFTEPLLVLAGSPPQ